MASFNTAFPLLNIIPAFPQLFAALPVLNIMGYVTYVGVRRSVALCVMAVTRVPIEVVLAYVDMLSKRQSYSAARATCAAAACAQIVSSRSFALRYRNICNRAATELQQRVVPLHAHRSCRLALWNTLTAETAGLCS